MLIRFHDSSGHDYFDGNWVAYWGKDTGYICAGKGDRIKVRKYIIWEGLYEYGWALGNSNCYGGA